MYIIYMYMYVYIYIFARCYILISSSFRKIKTKKEFQLGSMLFQSC